MSKPVRPLIAGNWKMNGLRASLSELAAMTKGYDQRLREKVELLVCPPATLLSLAAAICADTGVKLGAQDCHAKTAGAHTGEISAEMVADAGAEYVILGHSERRTDCGERDGDVRSKADAAIGAGLTPIICIGETEKQRQAGEALATVITQLRGSVPDNVGETLVIAYEPVWAIGTGLTPTVSDVTEVHDAVRTHLRERFGAAGEAMRILYGGSVKPGNAAELMAVPNVSGALVGGASLKAADFLAIAAAVR